MVIFYHEKREVIGCFQLLLLFFSWTDYFTAPFTIMNSSQKLYKTKGEAGDGAVGKFGTGFITTYHLNNECSKEVVQIGMMV